MEFPRRPIRVPTLDRLLPNRPRALLSWRIVLIILCANLAFSGLALFSLSAKATAQTRLSAADQAVLDQVRSLTSEPDDLAVQQLPDGTYFVDLKGSRRAVLLAVTDTNGQLRTRCVGTVEEAAAFLNGSDPLFAAAFSPDDQATGVRQLVEASPTLRAAAALQAATSITIAVGDGPGEGFNDPTGAAPVGGNSGTTVGQQRLRAFQYAASIWAAYLQSTVPIVIDANFDPLDCNATSGVLGAAGPQAIYADFPASGNFPGAEFSNTWYVEALANKRSGSDLDPLTNDIIATFNSNLGKPNCIQGSGWYYGLDGNAPANGVDLVTVLLHEFGHGLGFLSLVSLNQGTLGRNYPYNPAPANNRNDVWNYYLYDNVANKLFKDMTDAERGQAVVRTNALVWNGPAVRAAASNYLQPMPVLTVTAPVAVAGTYSVGSAAFGPPLSDPALAGALVAAIDSDEDGAGGISSNLDACSALSNAAAVAGKIALINRGGAINCTFTVKVKNAQNAGAIGVVIANNMPGGPPGLSGSDATITIPTVSISQTDGTNLRTALGSATVTVQLGLDQTRLAGADNMGRVRLYAPPAVQGGSSVSHFDVSAVPNLLMEPSINVDLDQSLDLTDDLLRDIGWYRDINYNGRPDANEADVGVTLAVTPTGLLNNGDAVTLTLQVTNSGIVSTSAARLVNDFPVQLGTATWTASYSGGASGPASGSGDINALLNMPSGGVATFTIRATLTDPNPLTITNTATVTLDGNEIDAVPENNQASVIIRTGSVSAYTLYIPLIRR